MTRPTHSYAHGAAHAQARLGLSKRADYSHLIAPAAIGGLLGAGTGAVAAGEGSRTSGALLGGALGAAGGAGGAALGGHTADLIGARAKDSFSSHVGAQNAARQAGALLPTHPFWGATADDRLLALERISETLGPVETAGAVGGTVLGMGAASRMAPGPAPQPNQDPYGYYQY